MIKKKLWLPLALVAFVLAHIWGASLLAQAQGQPNPAPAATAASRD